MGLGSGILEGLENVVVVRPSLNIRFGDGVARLAPMAGFGPNETLVCEGLFSSCLLVGGGRLLCILARELAVGAINVEVVRDLWEVTPTLLLIRCLFTVASTDPLCLWPEDEAPIADPVLDVPEDEATELLPEPKPNRLREFELTTTAALANVLDETDAREVEETVALLLVEPVALTGESSFTSFEDTGRLGPVVVEPTPFQTFLTRFLADERNPKRKVGPLAASERDVSSSTTK